MKSIWYDVTEIIKYLKFNVHKIIGEVYFGFIDITSILFLYS